jgi:hypothetical protein
MFRPNLLVIAFSLAPVSLAGQASLDTIHPHNRCRLTAQIIELGDPAPHERWAYQVAPSCGADLGRTIANRLSALRASTDTAELRLLTTPASQLHDGAIFSVSLNIAGDKSASSVARPFAFRNLIWLISYGADLTNFDPWNSSGLGCSGAVHDRPSYTGVALPGDFKDRVKAAAYQVARDASEPGPVRRAALCTIAYGGWERQEAW